MADDRIRIDALDPTVLPSLLHELPAMKDGLTVKLTVAQVQALMKTGPNNVALALKDLSNTVGPRGKVTPLIVTAGADYNSFVENGFWSIEPGAANAPEPSAYYLLAVQVSHSPFTYLTQYASAYGTDSSVDSKLYKRELNAGVWTAWYRVRENEAELDARYAVWEVGQPVFSFSKVAPFRCIKANGAAVARATYTDLDTAIYCGDADNATADWGYRCTNPASPSSTRSTTGPYIVVPDVRGEFLRGWDDSRGVDAGRSFWAAQTDLVKAHTHPINDPTHSHGVTQVIIGSGSVQMQTAAGSASVGTQVNFAPTGITVQANTGAENRPRNLSPLVYIRY